MNYNVKVKKNNMYDRLKRTDRDQNEPILMFDILG